MFGQLECDIWTASELAKIGGGLTSRGPWRATFRAFCHHGPFSGPPPSEALRAPFRATGSADRPGATALDRHPKQRLLSRGNLRAAMSASGRRSFASGLSWPSEGAETGAPAAWTPSLSAAQPLVPSARPLDAEGRPSSVARSKCGLRAASAQGGRSPARRSRRVEWRSTFAEERLGAPSLCPPPPFKLFVCGVGGLCPVPTPPPDHSFLGAPVAARCSRLVHSTRRGRTTVLSCAAAVCGRTSRDAERALRRAHYSQPSGTRAASLLGMQPGVCCPNRPNPIDIAQNLAGSASSFPEVGPSTGRLRPNSGQVCPTWAGAGSAEFDRCSAEVGKFRPGSTKFGRVRPKLPRKESARSVSCAMFGFGLAECQGYIVFFAWCMDTQHMVGQAQGEGAGP